MRSVKYLTSAHLEELYAITKNYSTCIRMKFDIEKCRTQTTIRDKIKKGEDIETTAQETIVSLDEHEKYKYLGVLQKGRVEHTAAKAKLTTEFTSRLKQVLRTSLNARNLVTAINNYCVPVLT
jgi:hypothetical protein